MEGTEPSPISEGISQSIIPEPKITHAVTKWVRNEEESVTYYMLETEITFNDSAPDQPPKSVTIECYHRYSELLKLRDKLSAINVEIPQFPKKNLFEKSNRGQWDRRQIELDIWFRSARSKDIWQYPFVRKFLQIRSNEQLWAQVFGITPLDDPPSPPGKAYESGSNEFKMTQMVISSDNESDVDDDSLDSANKLSRMGSGMDDSQLWEALEKVLIDTDNRMIDVALHGHWYEGTQASQDPLIAFNESRRWLLRALTSLSLSDNETVTMAAERIATGKCAKELIN